MKHKGAAQDIRDLSPTMNEKIDPTASVSAIGGGLSGDDGANHKKSESDNSLKAVDAEVENGQVEYS